MLRRIMGEANYNEFCIAVYRGDYPTDFKNRGERTDLRAFFLDTNYTPKRLEEDIIKGKYKELLSMEKRGFKLESIQITVFIVVVTVFWLCFLNGLLSMLR